MPIRKEPDEIEVLKKALKTLNKELAVLRKSYERLENDKEQSDEARQGLQEQFAVLKQKINEQEREIRRLMEFGEAATESNKKLTIALQNVSQYARALKEEVEKLTAPPNGFGLFLRANDDGTIDVSTRAGKFKVNVRPGIDIADLKTGQELVLNDAFNVIGVGDYPQIGEEVTVDEILDENTVRVFVGGMSDNKIAVSVSGLLKSEGLKIGDKLLRVGGIAVRHLPREGVGEYLLEGVPSVTYDQIGGLANQITKIRDAIELPYLEKEAFKNFAAKVLNFQPTKGILLYGPPGCGKTLLAKAVASQLSTAISSRIGKTSKAFFINIKGPELLNKYVGESERKIREIYKVAKRTVKENEDCVVVIFIDEADSLLRMRGLGISSDMESTIVPQFLSELDGVEQLSSVVTILASNRSDLIDPAILRPGRIDLKIKIDHPDRQAAEDILKKYITAELPFHPRYRGGAYEHTDYYPRFPDQKGDEFEKRPVARREEIRLETQQERANYFVKQLLDTIFFKNKNRNAAVEILRGENISIDNRFIEVVYNGGQKKMFYFSDFISGATLANIVHAMVKKAIKAKREQGEPEAYLLVQYGREAIADEFRAMAQLTAFRHPEDWARIYGEGSGEKILAIRSVYLETYLDPNLIRKVVSKTEPKQPEIKTITPGHFL